MCQGFLLVSEGSSENTCGRWTQVELLSFVSELWDKMDRQRSIWESRKEIDWCNHTPSSLEQQCQLSRTHDKGDPAPSPHQAEGSDLKDRGEWIQDSAWDSRISSLLSTLPSQVPLYNGKQALELEGQGHEVDDDSSILEESSTPGQPIPHFMTTSIKKKNGKLLS